MNQDIDMRNFPRPRPRYGAGGRAQRGAATLFVVLMILIILTIIVLASSNVSLFEQKTATNENRQQLADQAAEYALNLGGEFLKANVVHIGSNEDDDGWLKAGANLHWQPCPASPAAGHPCEAERDDDRRKALYYYTATGAAITNAASNDLNLPTSALLPLNQATIGAGSFPVSTNIRALLCRLDTTPGTTPSCQLTPTTGNRVAVTLIASAAMDDESAAAEVKETWATFNSFSAQAAVPLVASGLVTGLGNATIVAAPNAGGYGLPGSIWSPQDVDVDGSSGGVGSVLSCHLGDYLQDTPVAELQTTCATDNNACGCDVDVGSSDYLSGHIGGTNKESVDVLDVDDGAGAIPDIQFYPGRHVHEGGTDPATQCMDDSSVDNDDNLFEWIFGKDVNGASTCDTAAIVANEDQVLDDLGGEHIANCNSLDSSSSGLYYMGAGDGVDCDLPGDIGSPAAPVVLVVNDEIKMNSSTVFGMVYVRDTTGAGTEAEMQGVGNSKVFGSVVVEGNVFIAGGIDIVYVDSNAGKPGSNLPITTRFARLPGSWLDSRKGF